MKSDLLDFQRIMCGAHIAESRFKKEPINFTVPLSNKTKFLPVLDEINEFLEWLTDYDIKLSFSDSSTKPINQQRLSDVDFDYVCLFSGGLDSASLPLTEQFRNKRGLLHHTHTNNRMLKVARTVHANCMDRRNKIVISKLNLESFIDNPIMHTRGLSFLTNLLCMAEEFNIKNVVIPENGPFMINYPVSTIVSPTRTADPDMIEKWISIFRKITGSKIEVHLPFLSKTKSEVILMSKEPKLIKHCWSCSTSQGRSHMCGICVACFVRMISLGAIGLAENLNVTYQKNPFLLDITQLGVSNRETFRVLLHSLKFWYNIIEPNSAENKEEQERLENVGKEYPVLKNHALDMYLGLREFLRSGNNSHILGKTAENYLNMLDSEILEKRLEHLQNQRNRLGW